MSRQQLAAVAVMIACHHTSGMAQSDNPAGGGATDLTDPDCRYRQEAALISGEIVVCGDRSDNARHRLQPEGTMDDYAEKTMDKDLGLPPDFRPPPCVSSWLTWCPKFGPPPPPAVMIDVQSLPEAPPGSDAALIAEGAEPQ